MRQARDHQVRVLLSEASNFLVVSRGCDIRKRYSSMPLICGLANLCDQAKF